jgi:hypothetical protein
MRKLGSNLLIGLADRYGLQVVVNLIPEGAPPWTLEGNEDSLYATSRGERITWGGPPNIPSGGWPGLCVDKPSSAALVGRFARGGYPQMRDIRVKGPTGPGFLSPVVRLLETPCGFCRASRWQLPTGVDRGYHVGGLPLPQPYALSAANVRTVAS